MARKLNEYGFADDVDYSSELLRSDLSDAERAQLTQERQNKIMTQYGGNEPEYAGTGKTFTQLYGNNGAGAINVNDIPSRKASSTSGTFDFSKLGGVSSSELAAILYGLGFNNEAPNYQPSAWDRQAEQLMETALGMNYDDYLRGDAYNRLQRRYTDTGSRAMQDTLAQLAARTGGLASSYATSAAAQQYNQYMAQLEDVARQMYENERSGAIQNAQLAQGMSQQDYQRYIDSLGQWNNDRGFRYNVIDALMGQGNYESEQEYTRGQADKKDAQDRVYQYILGNGGKASDLDPRLIAASGYSTAELAAMEKAYADNLAAQQATRSSSGGGRSSSSNKTASGEIDWTDADEWAERYGEDAMSDFFGDPDNRFGMNKTDALAKWRNHWREAGDESSGGGLGTSWQSWYQRARSAFDNGSKSAQAIAAILNKASGEALTDNGYDKIMTQIFGDNWEDML